MLSKESNSFRVIIKYLKRAKVFGKLINKLIYNTIYIKKKYFFLFFDNNLFEQSIKPLIIKDNYKILNNDAKHLVWLFLIEMSFKQKLI
jgi:hypothetical protein